MKKKILVIAVIVLAVLAGLSKLYLSEQTTEAIETMQNAVLNEIDSIEEQEVTVDENSTVEDNQSTTEIQDLSVDEEIALEEQEVESEAFELQGEIAYEGDKAQTWGVELGDYAGLTYYSQVDSRWKNHSYTSTNNSSQTIGSSGCGPTSAAMIVSSIKGTITPDTMRRLIREVWIQKCKQWHILECI